MKNVFFWKEDKILIKNLRQQKGYTATRFLRKFKTKNWTRGRLKTLLEKIDRIGSIDCVTDSGRPRTAHTAGNVAAISQWRRHLSACVRAHGAHFEHKFWQFWNESCVYKLIEV